MTSNGSLIEFGTPPTNFYIAHTLQSYNLEEKLHRNIITVTIIRIFIIRPNYQHCLYPKVIFIRLSSEFLSLSPPFPLPTSSSFSAKQLNNQSNSMKTAQTALSHLLVFYFAIYHSPSQNYHHNTS